MDESEIMEQAAHDARQNALKQAYEDGANAAAEQAREVCIKAVCPFCRVGHKAILRKDLYVHPSDDVGTHSCAADKLWHLTTAELREPKP